MLDRVIAVDPGAAALAGLSADALSAPSGQLRHTLRSLTAARYRVTLDPPRAPGESAPAGGLDAAPGWAVTSTAEGVYAAAGRGTRVILLHDGQGEWTQASGARPQYVVANFAQAARLIIALDPLLRGFLQAQVAGDAAEPPVATPAGEHTAR
jgi:hypothetical protein